MKLKYIIIAAAAATALGVAAEQTVVNRIEQMPAIPQPYQMRDWKQVTADYVDLVLNPQASGLYLPLVSQQGEGHNYPQYAPLRLDTYVGWGSHGRGSEAINVMPAVVSAYLTGTQGRTPLNLAEGIMDFYNLKNGQNVYLNGFSAFSGNDWWYDLMPNVYFYQLYHLTQLPPEAEAQYRAVADRWLEAVEALGGDTYAWKRPDFNHRAFNLGTMKPLSAGVVEPESAGTVAMLLFNAWQNTNDARYRRGAELAMEYLSGLGNNPAYELQLAYGVQTAAKMNAILGTDYRTAKLFANCFDRGYLRGWGSIVGTWGGYDVSGLIGEANDKGDDYAFVMNGFQQMAALAPAVRYDKRLARAFGRWALNVANASRLFYRGFMPDANYESASLAWSREYDPAAAIPYESIKQKWEGKTPLAMGDAVRGGWAATNLSLYSGSSVGYMAAVVATTDCEAILQLNLTATDLDGRDHLATYLYYNPYTAEKTVTLPLPVGTWRIYDTISESWIADGVTSKTSIAIPADGVVMAVLVPATAQITTKGRVLSADALAVDYNVGYDFGKALRIKNVEALDAYPVKGELLHVQAAADGITSTRPLYIWHVDDARVEVSGAKFEYDTSGLAPGKHTVTLHLQDNGNTVAYSIPFTLLEKAIVSPELTGIHISGEAPYSYSQTVEVTVDGITDSYTSYEWEIDGGNIDAAGATAVWQLPYREGAFRVRCTASTIKGKSSIEAVALVRTSEAIPPVIVGWWPFDGNLYEWEGSSGALTPSGSDVAYGADHSGNSASALRLGGDYVYLYGSGAPASSMAFRNTATIAFWAAPDKTDIHEQFVVSHGSWQNRFKVSVTPDGNMRWTLRTASATVDLDAPAEAGVYHHYAGIYTGFSIELYLDGELAAYAPLSGLMGTSSEEFTVGCMLRSDQQYNYRGLVDELMVFETALTPAQVKELYNQGAVGIENIETDSCGGNVTFRYDGSRFVASDASVKVQEVYDASGTQVDATATLAPGVYFVKWRSGNNATGASKVIIK